MNTFDISNPYDPIPVSFEWQGTFYRGTLQMPVGIGGRSWFLMIDNYYYGSLNCREGHISHFLYQKANPGSKRPDWGWTFDSPSGYFEDMADYFRDVVLAWYC